MRLTLDSEKSPWKVGASTDIGPRSLQAPILDISVLAAVFRIIQLHQAVW